MFQITKQILILDKNTRKHKNAVFKRFIIVYYSGRKKSIQCSKKLTRVFTKDPRTTSKELRASPASLKVGVHDSTIRKRQQWPAWQNSRQNPCWAKLTWSLVIVLPENILMILKTLGKIICRLMRQKLCVSLHNAAIQKRSVISTVKQ